jgi:hypothetical protein
MIEQRLFGHFIMTYDLCSHLRPSNGTTKVVFEIALIIQLTICHMEHNQKLFSRLPST